MASCNLQFVVIATCVLAVLGGFPDTLRHVSRARRDLGQKTCCKLQNDAESNKMDEEDEKVFNECKNKYEGLEGMQLLECTVDCAFKKYGMADGNGELDTEKAIPELKRHMKNNPVSEEGWKKCQEIAAGNKGTSYDGHKCNPRSMEFAMCSVEMYEVGGHTAFDVEKYECTDERWTGDEECNAKREEMKKKYGQ